MGKKRRKNGVNVSEAIRAVLADQPNARPSAIAKRLKEKHNISVSAQYISTIKSNHKRKSAKTLPDDPTIQRLYRAREFAKYCGSIDNAIAALTDWKRLCGDVTDDDDE